MVGVDNVGTTPGCWGGLLTSSLDIAAVLGAVALGAAFD